MVIALNEAGNGVSSEGSAGERDFAGHNPDPEIRRQVTAENLEGGVTATRPHGIETDCQIQPATVPSGPGGTICTPCSGRCPT
jgi:hypothetical protein